MYKNKNGFTLVEAITAVLIVGIVAAILLFGFSRNRDKEFQAKYDKIVTVIKANIKQDLLSTTGMTFADYQTLNERYRNTVTNNLNVKSSVAAGGNIDSFWSNTREIYNTTINNTFFMYQLNDETVIAVSSNSTDIFIDVNGTKGPNTVGKDIRNFDYTQQNQIMNCGAGCGAGRSYDANCNCVCSNPLTDAQCASANGAGSTFNNASCSCSAGGGGGGCATGCTGDETQNADCSCTCPYETFCPAAYTCNVDSCTKIPTFNVDTSEYEKACVSPNNSDYANCTNCYSCYTNRNGIKIYYDSEGKSIKALFGGTMDGYIDYVNGIGYWCHGPAFGFDGCWSDGTSKYGYEKNYLERFFMEKDGTKDGKDTYKLTVVSCSTSQGGCTCGVVNNWQGSVWWPVLNKKQTDTCGEYYNDPNFCTWSDIEGDAYRKKLNCKS